MYEYVDESVLTPYRKICSDVMIKLRDKLNEDYNINAQFSLVGSGTDSRNMVTKNDDGPMELDYNLLIFSMPDGFLSDLKKLKDTVRDAMNKVAGRPLFLDGKDTEPVITSLLHPKNAPQIQFRFAVTILTKNEAGNWCRLIRDAQTDGFAWCEMPDSFKVTKKAQTIKAYKIWGEVRDEYLNLKNAYLQQGDPLPSCSAYAKAVNKVYRKHFKE